jgi:argininosuccinate synthase
MDRDGRVVLAYSGDLDTSVAIPWLIERAGAEVVTVTCDVGQGHDVADVRDRALAAGAVEAHVLDVREEFARDFVLRALKANATDDTRWPLAASLAVPLIARRLAEIAATKRVTTIVRTRSAEYHEPVRLDTALRTLDPQLKTRTPACEWSMTGDEKIAFARARGVPVPMSHSSCTVNANLWGRTIACRNGYKPVRVPPDLYIQTKSPVDCPDEPAFVELSFERGVPKAINEVAMPLLELIASLTTIAGAHGVGRRDVPRPGRVGVRDVSEAPAATVLHTAHGELQRAVAPDMERFSRMVGRQYASLILHGLWFTPLREALDGYVNAAQERVSGVVRLELFKGACRVVPDTSPSVVRHRAVPEPVRLYEPADPGASPDVCLPAETISKD